MSAILYLLVSLCLTSFVLGIIFLMAWATFGRKPYALAWSGAFFVSTLQWILNALQGVLFSDPRAFWVVANVPAVVSVSLALLGHRQRAGLKTRMAWLVGAGVLMELLIVWFTYVHPHVGLQVALAPGYAALLLGWCAVILVRYRPHPLPAEWGAAVATGAFALAEGAAAFVALLQGAQANPALESLYLKINFLGMPAGFTGMGLFVVFILASDLADQMTTLAMTDGLTGVANRRGFTDAAARAVSQARRAHMPLSLIIADLDHFKSINDAHGHDVGDAALRTFARHLVRERRASDLVGRLGGEEFGILLPGAGLERATEVAERIREALKEADSVMGVPGLRMTCSFGVAAMDDGDRDMDGLFKRADQALYAAKANGRDRVETA